jgi:predicted nucleic acid-binding protein
VVFVDTGAWFAGFVPNDPDHAAASAWLEANRETLVTSDYIFDELMTVVDPIFWARKGPIYCEDLAV